MLEYSEYESIVDILEKGDMDETYKTLIKKEDKVLDTVNAVVNHYKDKQYKKNMFMHSSLTELYNLFFLEWPLFARDLSKAQNLSEYLNAFLVNNRPLYIGIMCVLVGVFLFFIQNSS